MGRILIVDDDPRVLSSLQSLFLKEGKAVTLAASGEEALLLLKREPPDLVLMDVRMAGLSGLETFERAKGALPGVPVIIMTGHACTDSAIEAMKLGAFEYVIKPFQVPSLLALVEKALAVRQTMTTSARHKASEEKPGEPRLISTSSLMYKVYKLIGQVSASNVTVLIRGESGTGKELVAHAIHGHSERATKAFVTVNCAAIPETLLESELFGFERGAFTGATGRRRGRFEQAEGGTILLDEIGDMTPTTQSKVLRVLQERSFERLGGQETIRVGVRILAATNRNLENLVKQGVFREDLYYRLNVVTIWVPSLRERKQDISELTHYFLDHYGRELGKENVCIAPEALEHLNAYDWPGNVRELEHCVKQAIVLCRSNLVQPEDLCMQQTPRRDAEERMSLRSLAHRKLETSPGSAFHQFVEHAESQLILEAMEKTAGNLARAAGFWGSAGRRFAKRSRSFTSSEGST